MSADVTYLVGGPYDGSIIREDLMRTEVWFEFAPWDGESPGLKGVYLRPKVGSPIFHLYIRGRCLQVDVPEYKEVSARYYYYGGRMPWDKDKYDVHGVLLKKESEG